MLTYSYFDSEERLILIAFIVLEVFAVYHLTF